MTALALLGAAACATATGQAPVANIPSAPPPSTPAEEAIQPWRPDVAPAQTDSGVSPPHMQGRPIVRAALLLPLSHANPSVRAEAESMLNAAELALFERGGDRLLLIPKDDGGTQAGGAAAARAALADGADVILGPLFAQSVTGAAGEARSRGVPVIAFSTDASVAGQGVYLLSFAPESEVARASRFAADSGARAVALLAADNALGRRVADLLQQEAQRGGASVAEIAFYAPGNVADAATAIEALAQARDAGAFDALYVTDNPAALRELSAILRGNRLTARDVMMLGPASWRDDPNAATLGVIENAYVPGPDQQEMASFDVAYRAAFGGAPSDLASLAYDAMALAGQMAGAPGDWDVLENSGGYMGAAGLFRLPPGGVAERGLAIYQLSGAGALLVDPAPARFEPRLVF